LQRIVQARIAQSVWLESDMLAANPVIRVRDGLARLLSPYL
jgi:hypothetical protein